MLVLRCADCRRKLWRYRKIGPGEVLRCHRDRIEKTWYLKEKDGKVWCQCGNTLGIDKGRFIKMIKKAFTYSGTKLNR